MAHTVRAGRYCDSFWQSPRVLINEVSFVFKGMSRIVNFNNWLRI